MDRVADQKNTSSEMPFLDHLEELRWRILKSLVALIITFGASFWLCMSGHVDVFAVLTAPIEPYLHGQPLYFTHLVDKFTLLLQVAGGLALVLASPVISYQVWAFLSPALSARERRVIIPVLVGAAGLFLCGVALSVFVFVPVTMGLMEQIKTEALAPLYTASEYFGFLFSISLAFGVMFELPILILALTALGLITPKLLTKYRRHAFIVCLVVCEVITPGDVVISTLILFVPVYGLYELSILVSWFVYRARQRRDTQRESIGAEAT
jgi:sec-independent protein translocase protein TatC